MSRTAKRNLAAGLVLAAAVFLVALGIREDQPMNVFYRAINICLECVGIG